MRYYTENTLRHGSGDPTGKKIATGLGWFSIALGALELVATRTLTRALGMRGNEGLTNFYGMREIMSGVGILLSKDPTPWVWARIAGDAMDIGTLAAHLTHKNPKRDSVALALANVAAVTAVDIYCAQRLSSEKRVLLSSIPTRDYTDRTGFPQPPEDMRGAAGDFEVPRDMRAPEPLRPYGATRSS